MQVLRTTHRIEKVPILGPNFTWQGFFHRPGEFSPPAAMLSFWHVSAVRAVVFTCLELQAICLQELKGNSTPPPYLPPHNSDFGRASHTNFCLQT